MAFTKTKEKTRETAAEAREAIRDAAAAVQVGIEESRETAAGALDKAGKRVRGTSRRAARAMHRGGATVADRLEDAAHRVEPQSAGPMAYARRHPMRLVFFFGLLAGFVVVLWFRRAGARWDDDAEADFYNNYKNYS